MYTVGADMLPTADRTAEAVELMAETLSEVGEMPHINGVSFTGEVLRDTDDPKRFQVASYSGRVTSMVVEPPSFNLLVNEAWLQIAECDCPETDVDMVFDDFEQAMEEAKIAQDLDEFAGAPTQDPHLEPILLESNTEITIRFDRLGWYGVHGIIEKTPLA